MMQRLKGRTDETEMPLLIKDGEDAEDNYKRKGGVERREEDSQASQSQVKPVRWNSKETEPAKYGTFTQEAGDSTGSTEEFRFIVLGSDNVLISKVLTFILRESQSCQRSRPGICALREARVHNRSVSVLTTPVYWLECLKSSWFFNTAVKSLKNEMEFAESMVFPGPHAFLLVIDTGNSAGKEHYLLKALSTMFGEKALDYCMVLFIDKCKFHKEATRCIQTCGDRHHVLKDTDQSVYELFKNVENMIQSKNSRFFTKHFEILKKVKDEYDKKERELTGTVQNLQKELEDLKTEHANEVKRLKDDFRHYKNHLQKKLAASKLNEQHLSIELNASKYNESQLKNDLERLQRAVQKDKELEQKLTEADVEQVQLTRGQPQYFSPTDLSEHKDEGEEKMEKDLQASGLRAFEGLKSKRRSSKELDPPNMSESEHKPLKAL